MSATNSTTNYALPIFIGTDKPAWLVDWNGAMTDIDAAIKGVDTDVQGAITSISGLSSTVASHTSSISTISGQITVITTNLNNATGNINTINSLIGNGTPTTTDQTLIGAINELHANQGDLADLTTPAVSLVAAINAISSGGAVAASAVSFDNTGTSLSATDVQAAIVELSQVGAPAASAVSYDNTVSGLTATNVQDAIDEVASTAGSKTLRGTATANQTYGAQLTSLQSIYSALTDSEKYGSVLVIGNRIAVNNDIRGVFFALGGGGTGLKAQNFAMHNATSYSYEGTTETAQTNNTNTDTILLYA